ncbi:hypothetical protein Ac2012v2_000009 [Leucoagaricus gongylophorus]
MSLPPAKKQIKEHPAKDAVTVPVNTTRKNQDVHRKIRLLGAIEALRHARLPTNRQLDTCLQYLADHAPLDLHQLSPQGLKLIHDLRDIINTTRILLHDKNADELLQNFIWHTRDIDRDVIAHSDPSHHLPLDRDAARSDSQKAARHLRTLLHIVLTNSEARKLFSDFSVIGRDLLSKSAAKASQTIAPSQDELRRADQAAPDHLFMTQHDPDSATRSHPPDSPPEPAPRPLDDILEHARARARQAGKDATRQDIPTSEAPEHAKKTGLMGKMKDITQNITDRIPSEHKDRLHQPFSRGRQFLTEEYFPEERREQFIFRGKKVVLECQQHQDYQTSIRWLLDYIHHYAKQGRQITDHQLSRNALTDPHVHLALREVRTLLERFANNTSLDAVIDAANVMIDDSKRDPQLRRWFKDVNTYIRRILLETGYVLDESCSRHGSELRESGRQFYDTKYRKQFDDLIGSVSSWFKAMGEDPVGYIPIPRIEYTDDSLDLVVENLALQGRNLFPNIFSLEANNYIKFSPYNTIADDNQHHITLHLEQMQADMRDVAFYYRLKGGFKMTDSGLADVLLGGRGLSSTIVLRSATRDKSSVFKVDSVRVKVDSLKFSIRDAKHNFLYKTIKPLATGLIKKQIEKAVRDALITGLEYIDGQLVAVRDRMETAKQTEGHTRTDVLKELFQNKKSEVKSKEEKEKSSQFKIVANKRDSILAPVGHPRGWVHLTEEREKAAGHGTEWRSEAFNLVQGTAGTDAGDGRNASAVENDRRTVLGGSGTPHTQAMVPPPVSSPSTTSPAHSGHVAAAHQMMLSGERPEVVPVNPEGADGEGMPGKLGLQSTQGYYN